jgi:hypothetical protein
LAACETSIVPLSASNSAHERASIFGASAEAPAGSANASRSSPSAT